MKYKTLVALVLILINIFIIYFRWDIILEMTRGRPFHELELEQLILPIILFIITFFLLIKNKKNETDD